MTENTNLRHWNVLGKTNPAHTKPFQRAGGFKGTATRPVWTEMRLTEHFGPCGVGWGCDEPVFQLVPAGDEILVFCTLRCWYIEEAGKAGASLYGVGGDKVLVKQQSGLRTDDEAYKKAFTDALGNAFKHLGAGADVHMGLFEDSKYVASVKREFAEEAAPQQARPAPEETPFTRDPPPFPGDQTARAQYPGLSEAGQEFAAGVRKRLEEATQLAKVRNIVTVNTSPLERLRSDEGEAGMQAYDDLMTFAAARETEFLSAA